MISSRPSISLAFLLLAAWFAPAHLAAQKARKSNSKTTQTTPMDSLSYALGILFANNLSDQGINAVDASSLAAGLNDGLATSAEMSLDEANALVREEMMRMKEEMGKITKAEGVAFLESNATNEGVMTTSSGLQYRHDLVGTGASPDANDEVTVHYRGTLLNGEEFDSSFKRGEPISFPLNGVIRGWTEGLQLMKEGGKTTFFIPEELAYGARPNPGGPIPPYAALIFEVELIKVTSKD